MNLNKVIMIENFNIRDNNWNSSYPYHLTYADTLYKIANSFNLKLSLSINLVST